jgi:hypothetical protein
MKKAYWLALALALILGLWVGTAGADVTDLKALDIDVHVEECGGDVSVDGATVDILDDGGNVVLSRVLANGQGNFTDAAFPEGIYDLQFSGVGFETATITGIQLGDTDDDDDIDGDDLFWLYDVTAVNFVGDDCVDFVGDDVTLSGFVQECGPRGNIALEGAAVEVTDATGAVLGSGTTDATGYYEIALGLLGAGTYTVTVSKDGYLEQSDTFDVEGAMGPVVIDGLVDIDGDGAITAADDGVLSDVDPELPDIDVIDGFLDMDDDGWVDPDPNDDGEILGIEVIDARADVDGDGDTDAADDGILDGPVDKEVHFLGALFNCLARYPSSIWPGLRVQLPALDTVDCETWLQVQNTGDDFTKALLVIWGDPGSCEPQAAGPIKAECTGLLRPGSAWTWKGTMLPSGAKSAIVYSLSTAVTGDDVVADVICEYFAETVLGDDDDWRRFDRQFRLGGSGSWSGGAWSFPTDWGQPLAITVNRNCPGDNTPSVAVNAAYTGISDPMEGIYDPVSGGYMYYAPLVWASFGTAPNDWNSIIHIQNSGDECSSIEIWFQAQDNCLRATIGEILSLAPGEAWQFDPNTVVGPDFQGSAWIRASQPLGIVVDHVGQDLFLSYRGFPADNATGATIPGGDLFSVGSLVNYAPLTYREYNGWDTGIQVQNLSSVVNAKVKVYFFDASGDIVQTIVDWICPRGSQTFFLPAINWPGYLFEYVGAARVESQDWWSPGDPGVDAPNVMSVVNLIKYQDSTRAVALEGLAYNAFSEPEVFDWQHNDGWWHQFSWGHIAIPFVAQQKQGVTSEIAIQNVNPWPGFTDFTVFLYDQNGFIDAICEKLNEKQVEYIDLNQWRTINPGFLGSMLIRPRDWHHGADQGVDEDFPALAAIGVERVGRVLTDPDIPGDESKGFEGFPIAYWWWGADFEDPCIY